MNPATLPYFLLLLSTSVASGLLALYIWRARAASGSKEASILMQAVTIWTLGSALEVTRHTLEARIWWSKVQYFGIVIVPTALLLFTIQFSGHSHWLSRRRLTLLAIMPLATLLLVWTNESHGLIWSEMTLQPGSPLTPLNITYGPGFYVHTVYSYMVTLISVALLANNYLRADLPFRRQYSAMLLATLPVLLVNLIYVTRALPGIRIDLTPFAFAISGTMMTIALFRFGLLDLIPVARSTILETMTDAVMVLDKLDRIVDANPAALALVQKPSSDLIGLAASTVLAGLSDQAEKILPLQAGRVDLVTGQGHMQRFFDSSTTMILDRRGQPIGRVLVLQDISKYRRAQAALERRDAILQAIAFAAERFLQTPSWDTSAQEILQRLAEATATSHVAILENQRTPEGAPGISVRHQWVAADGATPGQDDSRPCPTWQDANLARWEERLSSGEILHGPTQELPGLSELFPVGGDSCSIVVVPVHTDRTWWGCVFLGDRRHSREWTRPEIDALRTATGILESAILRQEAERERQARERYLVVLNDITTLALEFSSLQHTLQAFADHLGDVVDADACYLTLWDDAHGLVIPAAAAVESAAYSALGPLPGEGTITEAVLEAGHAIVVENVLESPFHNPKITQRFPAQSVLALPLIGGGERLGAALIAFHHPRRFSPQEIARGEQAAGQVALALARAKLLEQVHQQAQQLQQTVDTVSEGIVLLSPDRRVRLANPSGRTYLEILAAGPNAPVDQLAGQEISHFLRPPTDGTWHEVAISQPGQHIFVITAHELAADARDGGWVLVISDITRERELQARSQMQERLAAIGQLAAGIAHDFNNILQSIIGFSQLLAGQADLPVQTRERLDMIAEQGQRAAILVQQILDFSRQSAPQRHLLDLKQLVSEWMASMRHSVGGQIRIIQAMPQQSCLVNADSSQLLQMLANLANNALDSMPDGGELRIELKPVEYGQSHQAPIPEIRPGPWMVLSVQDTGRGIPAYDLPHIFEPFFSTKESGRGTGLGMAQVYGIVRQHDGCIEVNSREDVGTTVTIYLPGARQTG